VAPALNKTAIFQPDPKSLALPNAAVSNAVMMVVAQLAEHAKQTAYATTMERALQPAALPTVQTNNAAMMVAAVPMVLVKPPATPMEHALPKSAHPIVQTNNAAMMVAAVLAVLVKLPATPMEHALSPAAHPVVKTNNAAMMVVAVPVVFAMQTNHAAPTEPVFLHFALQVLSIIQVAEHANPALRPISK
jgi:hypothetical protein